MEERRLPGHTAGIRMSPVEFPRFDDLFSGLNQFLLELVRDYKAGMIGSWDDLDERVKAYFMPESMEQMETRLPGWKTMASYTDGITLVHVMCVFPHLPLYVRTKSSAISTRACCRF